MSIEKQEDKIGANKEPNSNLISQKQTMEKVVWMETVMEKIPDDTYLYKGINKIEELPISGQLATEQELKDISRISLQKGYEVGLAENSLYKKIEEYAVKKGIELELKKETFQKGYEARLAEGSSYEVEEMEEYATEKGIELEFKKELLQKGYEAELEEGHVYSQAREIEEYASEKGTELALSKNVRNVSEESYIRMIHNTEAAHVENSRKRLIEQARAEGIKLDYNKVVKMDYLDFLDVPEENRLHQEKEMQIGKASLKSEFYGMTENNRCEGKFILGIDPETKETKFIFDGTLGEHKDIGAKYGVDVVGGGWLEIDSENKKVIIKKESKDFGYEPRIISATVIVDNFPDYEVKVTR